MSGAIATAEEEDGRIRIPGTKASLIPPPDFVLAETFPGVQEEETSSSVLITVMDPFPENVLEILQPDAMAARGMLLVSAEDVDFVHVDGEHAKLAEVAQDMQLQGPDGPVTVTFRKWMGVLQMGDVAVLVGGTCPDQLWAELGPALKKSVLSMSWDANATIDPFDGLPFRIDETENCKIKHRLSNTLTLSLHVDGEELEQKLASIVVGSSLGNAQTDDPKTVAAARLLQLYGEERVANLQGEEIELAGLEGYELEALVRDESGKISEWVFQAIVMRGKVYYYVMGTAEIEHSNQMSEAFDKIVSSFRFVEN